MSALRDASISTFRIYRFLAFSDLHLNLRTNEVHYGKEVSATLLSPLRSCASRLWAYVDGIEH
jgi:hypothetical protein